MLIRAIQQRVKVGGELTVTLKTGKEIRGTLTEITDEYLVLENDEGEEFLRETEIAHFKVVRSAIASAPKVDALLIGQVAEQAEVLLQKETALTLTTPVTITNGDPVSATPLTPPSLQDLIDAPKTYPMEILAAVIETQARFQAAIRQGELQPYGVDFIFPEQEFSELNYNIRERIRSDWVAIQNSYQSASKIRELSRYNQIAERLNTFTGQHPKLAQAYYNLGCLYLQINRTSEALRAFSMGAVRFSHPGSWYNLAVIFMRRAERARACLSLQEYFRLVPPSQHLQAWFICTGLSQEHAAYSFLKDILLQTVEGQRSDDVRLIIDGFIYILKSKDQHEDALALTAYAQSHRLVSADLVSLFDVLIRRLNIEPLKAYTTARQEIETLADSLVITNQVQVTPEALPPPQSLRPSTQFSTSTGSLKTKPVGSTPSLAPKFAPRPVSRSPYANARYAQHQLKDFKEAERLFRQAIDEGDSVESAVKDLASLLRQRNRTLEAIKLLTGYFNQATDKLSIQNLLADMYQHDGDFTTAIDELRKIIRTATPQRRANLHRRVAYCYFKLEQFELAEKELDAVLKLVPNDNTAQRWLRGLREAKRSGLYADLDAIFTVQSQLLDFSSSISKFLEFHLERCTYQGVPEAQVRNRTFSEADLRKLDGLIEGAGRKRPGLRAQYHLSAARLALDLGLEDEAQVRESLRDFAGDMGDANLVDQRPHDVVMAFYSESFGVGSKWTNRLRDRLSQFIMLFYAPIDEIRSERLPSPEIVLDQALQNAPRSSTIIEGLLELSVLNRQVAEVLLPRVAASPQLCLQVAVHCAETIGEEPTTVRTLEELLKIWERGREFCLRRNQEVADEINFLQSQATVLDNVREQIRRVRDLERRLRGQLDRKRLKNLLEILELIYDYGRQQQYIERERLAAIIKNRISLAIDDIEKNPTRISLELFHSYLHALNRIVEDHFSQIQNAAEPDQLQVKLAIEKYSMGIDDAIECQVTISNETGRSPASNLTISVLQSPADEYTPIQQKVVVADALQGGQSVTYLLPLQVKQKAKQAQVFSLYYRLSYSTRAGREIETNNLALPIQIGSATEFQSFANPYAAHAEGSAVKDPKMFFGRELLLNRLVEAIGQSETNKSFVIYGQKRTGKSSVLYHLRRRLIEGYQQYRVVPVDFSIGDIVNEISDATFMYRIIQRLDDIFEIDLPQRGLSPLQIPRPSLEDFLRSPQLMFAEFMSDLRRTMNQYEDFRNVRFVLLLDEFSYVYGEIVGGKLNESFMKAWKAMLEKGYFGSVLAGQDVMRQFIDAYPNEFQVAQSERVTYLAKSDARDLIVNPILISETQESRYRGSAVERLIELTAGSPFYIQIFCNRLVEYMNRRNATYVTDADIERIADDLIGGANAIGVDKFDNLITPGDKGTGLVPKSDALAVLRSVAFNTRTQPFCDRSSINVSTTISVSDVLEDLVAREVLEQTSSTLYRIKVGLFHRWLLMTA